MRRVIGRSERRCEKKLDYCDDYIITHVHYHSTFFLFFFFPRSRAPGGAVSFV